MENKNILLISYAAGMTGFCPAEWLDDKLDSCLKLGYKVTLISSIAAKKVDDPRVTHYRVPSLSIVDLRHENEILTARGEKKPLSLWLWYPIIYTFGILLDSVLKRFAGGLGGGKISWGASSALVTIYTILTKRYSLIFSTGGPASGHGSALIAARLLRIPLITELQDPLAGEGIGRNSRSAKLLLTLELYLVKYSRKVIFVTKKAAQEAIERYGANNIFCIYPGAKKFPVGEAQHSKKKEVLRFIHLGTLYSTRNLDTFFVAVDELVAGGQLNPDNLEIVNLGDVHLSNKESYLQRSYFKQLPIRPREEAIAFASQFDVCLLVQHSDPRGQTTIPYKTYDYLNLGKPILGLTNNDELTEILTNCGHYVAHISDVNKIKNTLMDLIENRDKRSISLKNINAIDQTKQLLDLSL